MNSNKKPSTIFYLNIFKHQVRFIRFHSIYVECINRTRVLVNQHFILTTVSHMTKFNLKDNL